MIQLRAYTVHSCILMLFAATVLGCARSRQHEESESSPSVSQSEKPEAKKDPISSFDVIRLKERGSIVIGMIISESEVGIEFRQNGKDEIHLYKVGEIEILQRKGEPATGETK